MGLECQRLPPHLLLHRIGRLTGIESSLVIVSHCFEWTVTVPRFGQSSGVEQQEILRPQNLPLDNVDEFVEVQGLIGGGSTLEEVGVQVRDAADWLTPEVGKLLKSKCRKRRHWQAISRHHAGGLQDSCREVVRQKSLD